jgi:hypothetical protein
MNFKIDVLAEELTHAADEQEPAKGLADQSLINLLSLVASNPMTSSAVLDAISKRNCPELLCAVALNPNTDLNTLQELTKSEHACVRACVAKHASATHFMWKLSTDTSALVRYKLAGNESLPEHLFKVLLKDEDWRVVRRAKRTLRQLADRESLVRSMLVKIGQLRRAV